MSLSGRLVSSSGVVLAALLLSGECRAEPDVLQLDWKGPLKFGKDAQGLSFDFGVSRQKRSSDGYYGRLGYRTTNEGLLGQNLVLGLWLGGDFWQATNGSGAGLPAEILVGAASKHLLVMAAGGASLLSVDQERDRTGVGIFSPRGGLLAGVAFEPVRLLLDARAIYRWHFSGPATPQVQLGFSLEFFAYDR